MSDQPVITLAGICLSYGKVRALDDLSITLPAGRLIGLIGPDGVGKSSFMALVAGSRKLQRGRLEVLGANMAKASERARLCRRVAYMPQGLGKNLYATLSAYENLDFFGRLFGLSATDRKTRIDDLLGSTGLAAFRDRPAGKMSGGMRQKLGLCCALIHDPDLLILDEPTTGVDPLARNQFWALIARLRDAHPGMSVLVATAYMEEARQFDWLVAMYAGKVLIDGSPADVLKHTATTSLEEAFVAVLPESRRLGYTPLLATERTLRPEPSDIAIEARELTCRFGDFTAVDHASFSIEKGEIFGFLGSNGCGKSTTMKMLTGLLPSTSGEAWMFGRPVAPDDLNTRRKVGYMSQSFSLYSELTVGQNLTLHAQLFTVPKAQLKGRIEEVLGQFGLHEVVDRLPDTLVLGMRQRLSLAVAVVHKPEVLILDEPTSGVDPIARDDFWRLLIGLARGQGVTIFISTHFMSEAMRCDRISFMHAGRVLATGTPQALVTESGQVDLEHAFIDWLERASMPAPAQVPLQDPPDTQVAQPLANVRSTRFSFQRLLSYSRRESMEIRRDPVRLTMAALGTLVLMVIMSYGISLDVENLSFAVLDRDQTLASETYLRAFSGSRYVIEAPAVQNYTELENRLASGDIGLALEIPPGFGRDLAQGRRPVIAAWVDGAMPMRASTIEGYVSGIHATYLAQLDGASSGPPASLEVRYRYNPDVKSLPAMVPAIIPLLLIMIPAMLTALGIAREKELGSIINLYVTPVTRLEFLLGKQVPYVAMGMLNFVVLAAMAVWVFGVPIKGSVLALLFGALLYVTAATSLGLWLSTFISSQIAAIFGVAMATLVPAVQFSGLINPVSSLEGFGAVIGHLYPTAFFLSISRGVFSKALGVADLWPFYLPLLLTSPVLIGLSVLMLKKQEQ